MIPFFSRYVHQSPKKLYLKRKKIQGLRKGFNFQLLLVVLGAICRSVMLRLKLPLALKAAAKLQF